MKKVLCTLTVLTLLLAVLLASRLGATASTNLQNPIVGSWDVIVPGQTPEQPFLVTFFADGNMIATDVNNASWHGAWKAGANNDISFNLHVLSKSAGGQGFSGSFAAGPEENNIPFMVGALKRITVGGPSTDEFGTPIS